jgi:hypothetical protein
MRYLDYPEQYQLFIEEARRQGLIGSWECEYPLRFYVNLGDISLPADLGQVVVALNLMKEICPPLLRRVLDKEAYVEDAHDFDAGRRGYVNFDHRGGQAGTVSFSRWLLDRGIDMSVFGEI